jgi:Flp pilus assembly protein TadB
VQEERVRTEKHEPEEKEKKGVKGKERGKNHPGARCRRCSLGSAGLAAFGAVMWLLAICTAAGSLALATAIWFAVSVLLWLVRRDLRVYRT